MQNNLIYERFLELSKYHSRHSNNQVTYNTKLGKREVYVSSCCSNAIYVIYFDRLLEGNLQPETLFSLEVLPNGKINIIDSKIGQPEIFLAIYEIEQIIDNKEYNERDGILEKLFENIGNDFDGNLFNFTQYR